MENLNIDKFSPKKAELLTLTDKYKGLTINGIEDKKGFEMVDLARKDLKGKRVEIQKTGKQLRSEAIAFQKGVLSKEKELIAIIKPLEESLVSQQDKIKQEKLKIQRLELLPIRRTELGEVGVNLDKDITDEEILLMDNLEYNKFYLEQKEEFIQQRAIELQEKEDRLNREKEIEDAKKAGEAKAKQDAENERKMLEETRLRVEQKAKEDKERLEKEKNYKEFLSNNGCSEETKEDFHISKIDNIVTLYKKVDTFEIK